MNRAADPDLTDCVGDDRRIYWALRSRFGGHCPDREHYALPGMTWILAMIGLAAHPWISWRMTTHRQPDFLVYWSNQILSDGESINGSDICLLRKKFVLSFLGWAGEEVEDPAV